MEWTTNALLLGVYHQEDQSPGWENHSMEHHLQKSTLLEYYVPKSMQKPMLRAVHRNHLELSKVLILIQGWDGSEIQDSPHAYALAHSEVPGYN